MLINIELSATLQHLLVSIYYGLLFLCIYKDVQIPSKTVFSMTCQSVNVASKSSLSIFLNTTWMGSQKLVFLINRLAKIFLNISHLILTKLQIDCSLSHN